MLPTTLTHYWPEDELDTACGAVPDVRALSGTPTCAVCAAALAADDAENGRLAELAALPLTDDDARYAGVAVAASMTDDLAGGVLAYATHLTRTYAALVLRQQARRSALHGGRR